MCAAGRCIFREGGSGCRCFLFKAIGSSSPSSSPWRLAAGCHFKHHLWLHILDAVLDSRVYTSVCLSTSLPIYGAAQHSAADCGAKAPMRGIAFPRHPFQGLQLGFSEIHATQSGCTLCIAYQTAYRIQFLLFRNQSPSRIQPGLLLPSGMYSGLVVVVGLLCFVVVVVVHGPPSLIACTNPNCPRMTHKTSCEGTRGRRCASTDDLNAKKD